VEALPRLPRVPHRLLPSRDGQDARAFDHAVDDIERRTEALIARAFEQLRSAEGAADLLAKFRAMDVNTRASLRPRPPLSERYSQRPPRFPVVLAVR
jgi:hypothetical protein